MDFFQSQDVARRNTKLLLFLFFLAVGSLVLLTNLLVFTLVNFQDAATMQNGVYYFSWEGFITVSLAVVSLVAVASLFKLHSLKSGGAAVAEMMDGELLVNPAGNLKKRQLLNVVEEMAIAAGTPVPPVYLIRDNAINAFAAGYSSSDAVIGITYGAMENLSRAELQGVIAHEFSHIFNGDMRINIRLIGVLYGILMIALIGQIILRPSHAVVASRDRSHAGIMAIGIGLMIIGALGQFFGNLIKAAVSRQREYLADASAVQFTRNPKGIAGALKRIGGFSDGSVLQHPESAELSHTFFSEGVKFSFASLMATHPPLAKRIKRLEPSWDGEFLETEPAPIQAADETGAMGFASAGGAIDAGRAVENIENIGNPSDNQLQLAHEILAAIPQALTDAAHEPYSARALVYLIQLSDAPEVRDIQLEHLKESADIGVYGALEKLIDTKMTDNLRLPLLEMALPTLRQLSYEQYKLFLGNLDVLIHADSRVGLSEWAVQKMITKHLGEVFEGKRSRVRHRQLKAVKGHCELLLSMLAYSDKQSGVEPSVAFAAGQKALDLDISLLDKKSLSFKKLNQALDALAQVHPLKKPKLLKACIKTITADNVVSVIEQELMRTIADTLECPMPPFAA